MVRRLLTVAETFAFAGGRVIVGPEVDRAEARPGRVDLDLRRADGSCVRIAAYVPVPFVSPLRFVEHATVVLLDVSKDDVPIGSEVWTTS